MDCNVGRAHGFGRIAPTAQKLGYHLRELEAAMERYDGIEHHVQRSNTGGKLQCFHTARCEQSKDTWEEVQDLVLPF